MSVIANTTRAIPALGEILENAVDLDAVGQLLQVAQIFTGVVRVREQLIHGQQLKLLELDQEKFKASVERGATLQDYVELDNSSYSRVHRKFGIPEQSGPPPRQALQIQPPQQQHRLYTCGPFPSEWHWAWKLMIIRTTPHLRQW